MLSLVTVSPVISCCLSHHVFDQVNLWPAWVGIETANVVKKEQHKNYQDEDKKPAINKKIILRLRSLFSK